MVPLLIMATSLVSKINTSVALLKGWVNSFLAFMGQVYIGFYFARVAATSSIEILKTPYHAPRANAICERFLGSVRRECLDHMLIRSEKQLHRVLLAYVKYFNEARPHQGIHQQVPQREVTSIPPDRRGDRIIWVSVLGWLH